MYSQSRNQSITISHFVLFIYIKWVLEYYKPPSTAVAGICFPKLIYSSSHSQWVMVYYSISNSIDFKRSIWEVPFLVQLSVSRFGPMVEMQKELLYFCVLKCLISLKKVLHQALPQKLIIVQNSDEAGGIRFCNILFPCRSRDTRSSVIHRWMFIPCAVFSCVLTPVQNPKEKSKSWDSHQ